MTHLNLKTRVSFILTVAMDSLCCRMEILGVIGLDCNIYDSCLRAARQQDAGAFVVEGVKSANYVIAG